MTCSRCKKVFDDDDAHCPHCGESSNASGLFQTSTVLIFSSSSDLVYRSVDEVPTRLRTKLLKSTNGANSATILIADRRGRKEVAKAMRNLPGPAQRRLIKSILGSAGAAEALTWFTPARKKTILAVLVLLTLTTIGIMFTHRWQ